jgi:uncharacterized membrane protein
MTDINPNATPKPFAGDYEVEGRTVAAGRGWDWIVEAFALFRKAPGIWILIAIVLCVLFIVIGLIPLLGTFASALLFPIFGGGLMLGCKDLERDGPFEIEHLFAGFRVKTGDLVMVGAFNLIGWVVITVLVVSVIGGGLFMSIMRGAMPGAGISIAPMLIALLLVAGLSVPLCMAAWFAPVLIVLQDMDAGAAMKASLFACLRNWLPFTVYGVVLLLLSLLAVLTAGLGFLVLVPVLIASVYTSYHDIFCAGR